MHKLSILLLFAIFFQPTHAIAEEKFDHEPETQRLQAVLRHADPVELAEKTDAAIDAIVAQAALELEARGFAGDALRVRMGWAPFKGWLPAQMRMGDLGDHAALSEWLKGLYWEQDGHATGTLVDLLGVELCKFLHLNDIFFINAGIPVSFHLKTITEEIDALEYEVHFVPMCGAIAYWTVWGVCSAVTMGTGIGLVCTPAAMLARHVMVENIAPRFSDRFWERFYDGGLHAR